MQNNWTILRVGVNLLPWEPFEMTGECMRCGAETDFQVGDIWICESCYQARISCCPEFGPDDLTDESGEHDGKRSDSAGGPA
jgi:hypothetical protein